MGTGPALCGQAGIEGLVIHSLRDTYVSQAIKAGADVKILQACHGDRDPGHTYTDRRNCTGEVAEVIGQDFQI